MTLSEARKAFHGGHPAYGGIAIAEDWEPYRSSVASVQFDPEDKSSWGPRREVLITDCRKGSTHGIVQAGSGYYKTQCLMSTAFTWTASAIFLDPSEELAAMATPVRRRMGHKVHVLSLETAEECGFNALDWINMKSPSVEADIIEVVEHICGYTPHHDQTAQFFKDSGKSLLTCFLADMMFSEDISLHTKTLAEFRKAISVPDAEMRSRLKIISQISKSAFARDLAADLCDTVEETFSGLRRNALEDTKWLSIPAYAALVSGNSFKTSDVCDGRTDIFISLGLHVLANTRGLGRTIIGALSNAAYEAKGRIWGVPGAFGRRRRGRLLLALDEAWVLHNMDILRTLGVAGRKYRVTILQLLQSRAQMEQQWGKLGAETWEAVASWRSFAGVYEKQIAENISSEVGEFAVVVPTESVNTGWQGLFARRRSGGQSRSWHEVKRRVVTPETILSGMRDDEQILFSAYGYPARIGRPIAFRRPEMVSLMGDNPFNDDDEETEAEQLERREG